MKHHFDALGLSQGASQQEIQEAYDRLSNELNPSNNDNQEFFIEEYQKVQEAYKALNKSSILKNNDSSSSSSTTKKLEESLKYFDKIFPYVLSTSGVVEPTIIGTRVKGLPRIDRIIYGR